MLLAPKVVYLYTILILFSNSNNIDLLYSIWADCCMLWLLGGGTMVAMHHPLDDTVMVGP
jgi:hypothetical protein